MLNFVKVRCSSSYSCSFLHSLLLDTYGLRSDAQLSLYAAQLLCHARSADRLPICCRLAPILARSARFPPHLFSNFSITSSYTTYHLLSYGPCLRAHSARARRMRELESERGGGVADEQGVGAHDGR